MEKGTSAATQWDGGVLIQKLLALLGRVLFVVGGAGNQKKLPLQRLCLAGAFVGVFSL